MMANSKTRQATPASTPKETRALGTLVITQGTNFEFELWASLAYICSPFQGNNFP